METSTKNAATLASILILIFFIPIYFSWHTPQKNMIVQDLSSYKISKKTKSQAQHINEDEYNKLFQERFGQQPVLFNETQHALIPMQLIPEQETQQPNEDHDELLRQLKSQKKRLQRLYPKPHPVRKPQYEHHIHVHLDDAVEQLKEMRHHIQEKIHDTVAWYRHTMGQFHRMAQNQLAYHIQRIIDHEKQLALEKNESQPTVTS